MLLAIRFEADFWQTTFVFVLGPILQAEKLLIQISRPNNVDSSCWAPSVENAYYSSLNYLEEGYEIYCYLFMVACGLHHEVGDHRGHDHVRLHPLSIVYCSNYNIASGAVANTEPAGGENTRGWTESRYLLIISTWHLRSSVSFFEALIRESWVFTVSRSCRVSASAASRRACARDTRRACCRTRHGTFSYTTVENKDLTHHILKSIHWLIDWVAHEQQIGWIRPELWPDATHVVYILIVQRSQGRKYLLRTVPGTYYRQKKTELQPRVYMPI